jgi:glucose/arabinose dehydrogenase
MSSQTIVLVEPNPPSKPRFKLTVSIIIACFIGAAIAGFVYGSKQAYTISKISPNSVVFADFNSEIATAFIVSTAFRRIDALVFDQLNGVLVLSNNMVYYIWSGDGQFDRNCILDLSDKQQKIYSLALHRGYLYVAGASTIWRWPFAPDNRQAIPKSAGEMFIFNLGQSDTFPIRHSVNSILSTPDGHLYLSISFFNGLQSYGQLMRYEISDLTTDFQDGVVWARGLHFSHMIAANQINGQLWEIEPAYYTLPELKTNVSLGVGEINLLSREADYGYSNCYTSISNTSKIIQASVSKAEQDCDNSKFNQPPVSTISSKTIPKDLEFGAIANRTGLFVASKLTRRFIFSNLASLFFIYQ